VAFEDLSTRVDSPGVRNDPLAILGLQERSWDVTRPNGEVPQAIKLLNDYVHLSLPRTTRISATHGLSRSFLGNSDPQCRFKSCSLWNKRLLSLVAGGKGRQIRSSAFLARRPAVTNGRLVQHRTRLKSASRKSRRARFR